MVTAMMRAELRGKAPDGEDGLTAAVFSALSWIPTDVALLPLLRAVFPHVQWDACESDLEVIFWPKFRDRTEPDVLLLTARQAVVVEAKAGAAFGDLQLEREWAGLLTYRHAQNRQPLLLAVTDDPVEPQRIDDFRGTLRDPRACAWIPWTRIARILGETAVGISEGNDRLVGELIDFLRHRGVHMDYTGIAPEDNWALAAATRAAIERVYPQIAALQPALVSRLQLHGIVWGDNQRRVLWHGSRSLDWSHQWGVNSLLLPFRQATWNPDTEPKLIVLFDFSRARLCVGVRAPWPSDSADRQNRLSSLEQALGWRAVVGNWDVTQHAPDLPAEALTLEVAAEQADISARQSSGDAHLWVYKNTPMHVAPLEWITDTVVLARDLTIDCGFVPSQVDSNSTDGTSTPG